MKHYQITLSGRTLDVQVLSDPRLEEVEVKVDGQRFVVGVRTVSGSKEEAQPGPSITATPGVSAPPVPSVKSVIAPLPGIIKSVIARPGQQVTVGDHLLVIEAMKMDNVIRAPRAGTIDVVHVAEGHRVAHGQSIVEYRD